MLVLVYTLLTNNCLLWHINVSLFVLRRQVVNVGEDSAAIVVLAHGRAAQVLGHGARRPGHIVALAEDAVLAGIAARVLLVAPRTLPQQPVRRLAGLLGATRGHAPGSAKSTAAGIVPITPVVPRHVPRRARVGGVGD